MDQTLPETDRSISELAQKLRDTRRMCRAFLAMAAIEGDSPDFSFEIEEKQPSASTLAARLSDIWN
jgi:hypothetical protein